MEGKILKDRFTQVPNEILESLPRSRFSRQQMQLLLVLIRETAGFHRTEARLSLTDFSRKTGLRRSHISVELKALAELKIIKTTPPQGRRSASYSIEQNPYEWRMGERLPIPERLPNQESSVTETGTVTTRIGNPVPSSLNKPLKERLKESGCVFPSVGNGQLPLNGVQVHRNGNGNGSSVPNGIIKRKGAPPSRPPAAQVGLERFWNAYPKKVAKVAAEKAFNKINPDEELLGKILAGLENFKKSDGWAKDGGRFIPHPVTWLNNRRWEDEVEINQEATPWNQARKK